jgi:hypothetical protein
MNDKVNAEEARREKVGEGVISTSIRRMMHLVLPIVPTGRRSALIGLPDTVHKALLPFHI